MTPAPHLGHDGGFVRSTFGDLERYRELSYEELREDPATRCDLSSSGSACPSDEVVLETTRVLSHQQFSDLAAVPRTLAGRDFR